MSDRGKPRTADDYPSQEDIVEAYAQAEPLPPPDDESGSLALGENGIPENEYHPLVMYFVYTGNADIGWVPYRPVDDPYADQNIRSSFVDAAFMLFCSELDTLVTPVRKESP